jgi:hypothetical protein
MPQTRPEVNPKSFVPKKKLGAKTVGVVGASLARGKYAFGDGEVKGFIWFFSRREEKRGLRRMGDSEYLIISVNYIIISVVYETSCPISR